MNGLPGLPRYPRVDDPARFGRVAVLLGGGSAEREISLLTGEAVHRALLNKGVDAHKLDTREGFPASLLGGGYDRVWIALHGRGGEDGRLQGLLELSGLPYTGSGVVGSAIGMDKLRTKRLLEGAGIPTPRYRVINDETDLRRAATDLGLPLIVKPTLEGSSIGMSKVERPEQVAEAWRLARDAAGTGEVIAEEWVHGPEYTAAILHDQALPIIRIQAAATFYDYDAKYFSDQTRYLCPAGLDDSKERSWRAFAAKAFATVGATGWGRVDLMEHPEAGPLVLEINTVPGMTSHSLVPIAAAAVGIGFDELVWRVLETSLPPLPPEGVP